MQFMRALRDRIQRGEITCSVRLWQGPRVKVNGREVSVEHVQSADGAVTVLLVTGTLKTGDAVKISWQGLATGSAECAAE